MQKVTEILFVIFTGRKKRCIRGDTETGHKNMTQESDIFSRITKENPGIR